MLIPSQALILVADGRKMLFLRNHGDTVRLDLRTEAHDERADAKNSDLKTDAPGTNHQSVGYGRSSYQETDSHQLDEDRWAKSAAEEVNKRALANDFDALAIIAPPKTLGELRKHFHKETERRIIATFNKAMTDRPIDQIADLLVGEAAPPA